MFHGKVFDVAADGPSASSQALDAAMACVHALVKSGLNEEIRSQVIVRIFEELHLTKTHQQLTKSDGDSSLKGESSSGKEDNASKMNSKTRSEEKLEETLSSFLTKAVSSGALVLKDIASFVRCLEETKMERIMKENSLGVSHGFQEKEKMLFSVTHGGNGKGNFKFSGENEADSQERECRLEPKDNNPPVITQDTVSHVATAPHAATTPHATAQRPCCSAPCCLSVSQRKEKTNSPADGDMREGNPPQTNSKINSLTLANLTAPSSSSPGFYKEKEKEHVFPTIKPRTFLEAAKTSLQSSSYKASQIGQENEGKIPSTAHSSSNDPNIFKVDHDVLNRRLEMCRFSALGKVSLSKGDKPWTWINLKEKLDGFWGLKNQWRLISLGKGYYHIILSSKEDHDRVWSKEVLHLKPGVLRLQRWSFGIDPSTEKSTKAQVWFRIHNLPWCLWDETIISGIARKIGDPLRIDRTTLEGSFGHYARVLIEVDLSRNFLPSLLVDCNKHFIEVQICPENIPSFCRGCNSIGHSVSECRELIKMEKNAIASKSIHNRPSTTIGIRRNQRDLDHADLMGAQQVEWRKKRTNVSNSVTMVTSSAQSENVSRMMNVEEMVTDFRVHVDAQHKRSMSSDCFILSNQFSVLQSEDVVEEAFQSSENVRHREHHVVASIEHKIMDGNVNFDDHNEIGKAPDSHAQDTQSYKGEASKGKSEVVHPVESPNKFFALCDNVVIDDIDDIPASDNCDAMTSTEEEIITPKIPEKWSDIMDEEEEGAAETPYPSQEINTSSMETSSKFERTFGNITDFRAKLHEDCIWLNHDNDSKYDRDMCVEIEHYKNSAKATRNYIANLPKKDKKVKMAFRKPQGKACSPKE